jgi:hypothetical protein
MLDLFRIRLNEVKAEAQQMRIRPRLICGGGDGTCSFAMFLVFKALQADPTRADEGLSDSGNGFIWTDEDMEMYFPAFAQMPLGSGNDLANFLGWGKKYPGDQMVGPAKVTAAGSRGPVWAAQKLRTWFAHAINPIAVVANFDVWGLMPAEGHDRCNFKLCELTGPKGNSPKKNNQLIMKPAEAPVPFFVILYANFGFIGYEIARFQINRRGTAFANTLEHFRQGNCAMFERTPCQCIRGLEGVSVNADGQSYFPPRNQPLSKGANYGDIGFMNINSLGGGNFHAADRENVLLRFARGLACGAGRKVPLFNDGKLDMIRVKKLPPLSIVKNPGIILQGDKKKEFTFSLEAEQGKGIFMQYDGEGRFMFSPTGGKFSFSVRKAVNLPVVLGPRYNQKLGGNPDNGQPVKFEIFGETPQLRKEVMARIWKLLAGDLMEEMMATEEELKQANFITEWM